MKIKSIILGLLFTVAFSSCKNEPKTDEAKPAEEVVSKKFKVTLNLLLPKNDTIHLYYSEDNSLNFTEDNSIWVSATGSAQPQDVVFELPEERFPTLFRLDLGVNKENEKIVFKGFKFDYLKKSFTANENMVYNYFRVNTDNTNFDPITKELSRKDPKIAAGPCLYPLEIPLKTEIDKLAK